MQGGNECWGISSVSFCGVGAGILTYVTITVTHLRFVKCTNPPPDQNANGNVIKTYGVVLKLKRMGQGGAGNGRGGGFQDPRHLGWTP